MNLPEFLLARIAEDEAVARGAVRHTRDGDLDQWQYDGEGVSARRLGSTVAVGPRGGGLSGEGPHIARWDPARVLAECDAKRRIVNQLWLYVARPDPSSSDPSGTQALWIVKTLALPYADHPDYDEAWRS